MTTLKVISAGLGHWTIEDVLDLAEGRASVALSGDPKLRDMVDKGVEFIRKSWQEGKPIYGINTGYGASVERGIPEELIEELPAQLVRFHGCGLGRHFDEKATLAILAARLISLSKGYSGVRWELLENLSGLINHRVLPLIPEEGSVGASGDLTPLSYIAAALMGEREVHYKGSLCSASEALRKSGLKPLKLLPKEGLAIMNGTSVMTALACQAFDRAHYLERLCGRITALAVIALKGNPGHFDEQLFSLKPHPGQTKVAGWIREDLKPIPEEFWHIPQGERLQNTYALRCAPHIIGVLADALPWMRS
ncbi:MAG TPA: aromatic amino acid ammonia-lyase, partial [bacterium]|nr:aromatic amino acid ammonia-lyase [bacterium]